MHDERLSQVALSLLPGLGPFTIRQLISYCGSASAVFQSTFARLRAIPGIGIKTAEIIKSNASLEQARVQVKMAADCGSSFHFYTSKDYPFRLKQLDDAPVLLFCKGKPVYNNRLTLGIVGTRRPTPYGISAIKKMLAGLLRYRPTIISGLAYGIDIAAHLQALKLGLPTLGVLGSGLDHIYPDAHRDIAHKMFDQGGLVTELEFGTKPEVYHFPNRNRIIAGLSDALVVVEARKKGGALITAEFANNYGRKCFAVPGAIDAPASAGCNQLLAEGKASLLTSSQNIVDQLGWSNGSAEEVPESLPSLELEILKILRNHPGGLQIDKLCRQTQTPINKMASYLLMLEIKGSIRAAPGNKFVPVGK